MRSFRFLLSRRWVLFALTVAVLCYSAWWLGQWQFGRLADRKDSNAVVRANEDRPPEAVGAVLATGRVVDEDDEWRQVTATGVYEPDDTVIVRYRTRGGSSGIDVVVPLVTADGTALLVDRGWMPADNEGASPDDVPAPPAGEVTVTGWVRADATGDSVKVADQSTRAISSEQIGAALERPVYGGFVELEAEDGQAAASLDPVELPELNNGPHFFYGLQWWFFGFLAIFGFCYLAYDEWRSRRRGEEPDPTSTPDSDRKQRRRAKNAKKQAVRAAYQQAYADERAARDARAQSARSIPPSTGSIEPETKDAAGESTKAATRPNSSGSP